MPRLRLFLMPPAPPSGLIVLFFIINLYILFLSGLNEVYVPIATKANSFQI